MPAPQAPTEHAGRDHQDVEPQGATLAQLRAELAQLHAQLAQLHAAPVQIGDLDLRALAAALREPHAEPRPWRQIEELLKTPQSTVRGWLTARPERASS